MPRKQGGTTRRRALSGLVAASPFGPVALWEILDAVTLAIEEFVSAAGVPLCALENTTTGHLEQLLCLKQELLPIEIYWSGQRSEEGESVVLIARDVVERLVVVCRILSTADAFGAEAECPLTVWNHSGPGLLIHWLNYRICNLATVRSRRPHYFHQGGGESETGAMNFLVKRIYAMVFLDDPDLWDGSFGP